MIRALFWRIPSSIFSRFKYLQHRYTTFRFAVLIFVGASLAAGVCVAALYLLPKSAPLVLIQARSESLTYIVARTQLAYIPLFDVELISKDTQTCKQLSGLDGRFTGLLQPEFGAHVTYTHHFDFIDIKVSGGKFNEDKKDQSLLGHIRFSDDTKCAFHNLLTARFKLSDNEHPFNINLRPLPIAGPAVVGHEFGVPLTPKSSGERTPDLLKEGTIRIFGRTSKIRGDNALYPAPNATFIIPKGSKLTSFTDQGNASDLTRSWYGTVSIDKAEFNISATTEAGELQLYRPGRSTDEERFKTSMFAQIVNDPSLAGYSLFFIIFSLIFQIVLALIGVLGGAASRQESQVVHPEPGGDNF